MLIVSTTRGKYRLIAQRNGREEAVQADAGQIRDWVQSEFEPPYPARIRLTTEQAESLLEQLRATV